MIIDIKILLVPVDSSLADTSMTTQSAVARERRVGWTQSASAVAQQQPDEAAVLLDNCCSAQH